MPISSILCMAVCMLANWGAAILVIITINKNEKKKRLEEEREA